MQNFDAVGVFPATQFKSYSDTINKHGIYIYNMIYIYLYTSHVWLSTKWMRHQKSEVNNQSHHEKHAKQHGYNMIPKPSSSVRRPRRAALRSPPSGGSRQNDRALWRPQGSGHRFFGLFFFRKPPYGPLKKPRFPVIFPESQDLG